MCVCVFMCLFDKYNWPNGNEKQAVVELGQACVKLEVKVGVVVKV